MFDYKSFKDAEDKPSIRTFVFKSFSEVSAAVSSLVGSLFQNSSREAKYDSEDYPHELNDWIQGKNEDEEQEMEVDQRPAKTVQRPKENPEVKEPKVEQKIVQPLGKKSATEKKGA